MLKAHVHYCKDVWDLARKPDPHALIKLVENGNCDEVCNTLLGDTYWQSLKSYQKGEYRYYWAKVISLWYQVFADGSGVSPPSMTVAVR